MVRICEQTLRQRLDEFINTPAGDLTIEEFQAQGEFTELVFSPEGTVGLCICRAVCCRVE